MFSASNATAEQEYSFQDDSRRWHDDTGKHNIQAALVKYQDRTVTLRLANDKTISISLDKLSKGDQSYVVTKLRIARRAAQQDTDLSHDPVPTDETDASKSTPAVNPEPDVAAEAKVAAQQQVANKQQPLRPLRPHRLFGVDWYSAPDASQLATNQGKPVMWFRVLGDLTGYM